MNKLTSTIAAVVLLAVASVALSAKANAGAVLDRVRSTNALKVAVGTDWGPASHLSDKHELDGYDVEVVKGIAEHLGVQIKFVTPGWDIITAGKWEGRWDIAMGQMTPTKARAEKFDFSARYFYSPMVVVVHKNSKVMKLADLNGKVVGVLSNSTQESYAKHNLIPDWVGARPIEFQFTPSEVKTYSSTNVSFDDLRLGEGVRLDAVLTNGPMADDAIKAGYPLRKVDDNLFSEPAAIAILHGDKEFSEQVAAAVQRMRDDGTLSRMSIKWYGVDYTTEK